ncbi:hypothetical protein [uncultured Cellulomonas sp.]|uniref:hypothetical protein n=1 Tax=uncultured Cellulomonas sp. TaxID=189682 RepID=UPI0026284AE8|nr:hypothetical protein [uncultured Cellulomonas sp.]
MEHTDEATLVLSGARALGYRPQDDGEAFAEDVEQYDGPDVLGHGMVARDPHADAESGVVS